MRKPSIFVPKDPFPPNESSEKSAIKAIASIVRIRGNQYKSFAIGLIISYYKFIIYKNTTIFTYHYDYSVNSFHLTEIL